MVMKMVIECVVCFYGFYDLFDKYFIVLKMLFYLPIYINFVNNGLHKEYYNYLLVYPSI